MPHISTMLLYIRMRIMTKHNVKVSGWPMVLAMPLRVASPLTEAVRFKGINMRAKKYKADLAYINESAK